MPLITTAVCICPSAISVGIAVIVDSDVIATSAIETWKPRRSVRAAQTEVDEALLARQTDHRHGYNDRGLAPAHREIVLTVPEALDLIADMERAMLGVPIPLREFLIEAAYA
jgi:hypothetical protein